MSKKPTQPEPIQATEVQTAELPEGCEAMLDCEFAEVSGGRSIATHMVL